METYEIRIDGNKVWLPPDEDKYRTIDEAGLTREERLGLAACRMNCWMWDEYIGPKPEGFDQLPTYTIKHDPAILTKFDVLEMPTRLIKSEIGEANISKYWWIFELGETEEAWKKWYETERVRHDLECRYGPFHKIVYLWYCCKRKYRCSEKLKNLHSFLRAFFFKE